MGKIGCLTTRPNQQPDLNRVCGKNGHVIIPKFQTIKSKKAVFSNIRKVKIWDPSQRYRTLLSVKKARIIYLKPWNT